MESMIKPIGYFGKIIFLTISIIMKSIWNTTLTIVSLFAYTVLLIALVNYYGIDQSSINTLINLTQTLMKNWNWFFLTIFLLNLWDNKWRFKD